MHIKTVVFAVVALFGVTLHARKVCYGRFGCFSNSAPFNNALVKLPESPAEVGTSFHLYTRSNRETAQIIHDNDEAELRASAFDSTKRTFIVVHGFRGSETTLGRPMKSALLDRENCNVILVDWSDGAGGSYGQAAGNTRLVGAQIAQLIKLISKILPGSVDRVCIVGFSLGAHIAGYAGSDLRNTGLALGRITGLDPAGLFFTWVNPEVRLDPSDAQYVDVIHTDAGALGTSRNVGHIDFFPNGGSKQRGCKFNIFKPVESVACDHLRAPDYYVATVKGDCPWTAYPCKDYKTFERGNCRTCGGACPSMGFDADQTKRHGVFYLKTSTKAPFCDERPFR